MLLAEGGGGGGRGHCIFPWHYSVVVTIVVIFVDDVNGLGFIFPSIECGRNTVTCNISILCFQGLYMATRLCKRTSIHIKLKSAFIR